MAKKVSFSNEHQEISHVEEHYTDVTEATKKYFKPQTGEYPERFSGYSAAELTFELKERLSELNHTSSLSILSAIEAAFRIDYLQRCYRKKKDPVSRAFREIYKEKLSKASFERDILYVWKQETNAPNEIMGQLKGALKYRHWLAHGRYWEPKMGRDKYDFQSIYLLSQMVFSSFPFEGVSA